MTTLVARQPLQTLSMSSSQRVSRRLSARLQEKEDVQPELNGYHDGVRGQASVSATSGAPARRRQEKPPANKKRKIGYEEEDNGFMFTRTKARKPRPSTSHTTSTAGQSLAEKENSRPPDIDHVDYGDGGPHVQEQEKKRRNKMSFSTPDVRVEKPVRRSKRLSDEAERRAGSPRRKTGRTGSEPTDDSEPPQERKRPPERHATPHPPQAGTDEDHSATRIALPFADTPVIRKNKAMRERKGGKGERRSSLGLRGRRASSLIDSGNSNALPHSEVEVADFYKHIESEGLTEPRRMRQLLTWCATRAMSEQPASSRHLRPDYEDQSARLAARVIEEELLRDFANRSEMSDWFGREDQPKAEEPLPVKANPKNAQNMTKIEELGAQIKRLRSERQSLEALLRRPSIPAISPVASRSVSHAHPAPVDASLLSSSDNAILESLNTASLYPADISSRINHISASIGPTVNAFADGVHEIAQYRDAAERVSGRVLSVCAEKLEERDRRGRARAVGKADTGDLSPGHRDLTGILRSLSRIER